MADDAGQPRDGTPKEQVAFAAAEFGEPRLVRLCASMLTGADWEADPELTRLIDILGGRAVQTYYEGRFNPLYWPRVWATRAFLYVWNDSASAAIVYALSDEAWRVREMAAKVIAKREVADAGDALLPLLTDETPRVRAAAARAVAVVGEVEHAPILADLADSDEEAVVRNQASKALESLARRLDRSVDQLLD